MHFVDILYNRVNYELTKIGAGFEKIDTGTIIKTGQRKFSKSQSDTGIKGREAVSKSIKD